MTRLPSLLTPDDLPLAELTALRCDGVLVCVGSCFAPLDELNTPASRAAAAATGLPQRMIAERMTAAWIWGARFEAPTPHQFCTALGARVTHRVLPWLELREVVLNATDTVRVGAVSVTTPLRTLVDIARFSSAWGDTEAQVVEQLREIGGIKAGELSAELDRVNLPHKRKARQRLLLSRN